MNRLTARSPKNNMAYLINVKPDEQDVESPYPNTLRCIMDSFNRLAAYEDSGLSPEEVQELAKAKASVWIPVTERLPKTNKTYVICTDGTRVRELFYCDKRFLSGVLDQTNQVAHWMPLPPCPEAAEKAIAEVGE